jgi:tetratricopeptide (TPR) repeat protein
MSKRIQKPSCFPTPLSTLPFLLLCLLCLGAGLLGCGQKASEDGAPAASAGQPYFQTQFQDESQFIVESIVTDIAEMAFCAKNHTPPPPGKTSVAATESSDSPFGAPKYQIRITLPKGTIKSKLEVNGPIWSPEVYAAITKQIFDSLGLSSQPKSLTSAADTAMLKSLLDLTATNIETENIVLSTFLTQNFGDPILHERAAALMGAFALRENSGDFFEIRSPLCRITAHLALAQALAHGSNYGPNGQVAEILLSTLMNNQKDAVAKIASLDQNPPELAAWARALRARNTHDYRPLAAVKGRSRLETIECVRAFASAVDAGLAWEKLTETEKTGMTDPCRIVLGRRPSVEVGHVLLEISLPLEIAEASAVYQLSRGEPMKQKDFVTALNEIPERCFSQDKNGSPRARVIGWGQWAMFCQRHLCHVIRYDYEFMERRWGVPRDAHEFAGKCEENFSGLRLYPFVRRFNCNDEATYHSAVDDSFPVTRATPHLVPAQIWNYLCYRVSFANLYTPNPNPHINEWHKHNPPPGTAYDPLPRMNHPSLTGRPDTVALVEKLHERAPYDENIAFNLLRLKYNEQATAEQTEAVYQPVLEYDSLKMVQVGLKLTNDPPAFEAMMKKASALDPDRYFALGDYFAKRAQDDKAAQYLQQGMDLCQDAVLTANHADWLVRYYVRKGQTAKASKLADMAAEAYSFKGLIAKADFLEDTGKYAEALEYYKKIEERYESSADLIQFCLRYKAKTGRSDFDLALTRRLKILFPKGLEQVTTNDFKPAPTDGVLVKEANGETAKVGLNPGDVIVALDGIRLHNFEQYSYLRQATNTPQMDLIVWQQRQYRQIQASPPEHRFGVNMTTYQHK